MKTFLIRASFVCSSVIFFAPTLFAQSSATVNDAQSYPSKSQLTTKPVSDNKELKRDSYHVTTALVLVKK